MGKVDHSFYDYLDDTGLAFANTNGNDGFEWVLKKVMSYNFSKIFVCK